MKNKVMLSIIGVILFVLFLWTMLYDMQNTVVWDNRKTTGEYKVRIN
jgi:hypothetical protein